MVSFRASFVMTIDFIVPSLHSPDDEGLVARLIIPYLALSNVSTIISSGLASAFCDSTYSLWDSYFARYGYIFYLSKYYEVIGTVATLAPPSLTAYLASFY
jgi:hypothetical protein